MNVIMKLCFVLTLTFSIQACMNTEKQDADEQQARQNAKSAGYNVQLGLGYLRQGNMRRAKEKLMSALEQAPKSPDVLSAVAYYFERVGEKNRAIHFYQEALRVAPTKGAQLNNYGAYLCRRGEYKAANTYFMKASMDMGYLNTAGALENAGLCSLAIPDVEMAKHFFEKAVEQDPKRFQSLYRLAKIAFDLQHYKTSLAYVKRFGTEGSLNPAMLLLAYQASEKLGEVKQREEYAWLLRNRFPKSAEYNKLQESNEKDDNTDRNRQRA